MMDTAILDTLFGVTQSLEFPCDDRFQSKGCRRNQF